MAQVPLTQDTVFTSGSIVQSTLDAAPGHAPQLSKSDRILMHFSNDEISEHDQRRLSYRREAAYLVSLRLDRARRYSRWTEGSPGPCEMIRLTFLIVVRRRTGIQAN